MKVLLFDSESCKIEILIMKKKQTLVLHLEKINQDYRFEKKRSKRGFQKRSKRGFQVNFARKRFKKGYFGVT